MIATIQKVFCKECREWRDLPFDEADAAKLIALGLCYNCEFWHKLEILKDDPNSVRVKGKHYWIGLEDDPSPPRWRGMGGRRVVIRFHDGREVVSTNLWYQGVIPERWVERLPDNTEFVRQR